MTTDKPKALASCSQPGYAIGNLLLQLFTCRASVSNQIAKSPRCGQYLIPHESSSSLVIREYTGIVRKTLDPLVTFSIKRKSSNPSPVPRRAKLGPEEGIKFANQKWRARESLELGLDVNARKSEPPGLAWVTWRV